jgi:hypothetical protein
MAAHTFCSLQGGLKNGRLPPRQSPVEQSPRFHAAFAVFALAVEALNILKLYLTIH